MAKRPLRGAIVPTITRQFLPAGCDRSNVEVEWSDATSFALGLTALNDLPEIPMGKPAVAIVEIKSRFDGGMTTWGFATEKFILGEEVEVPLNARLSNLNHAEFSGTARLTFNRELFSFRVEEAELLRSPNLPPSVGGSTDMIANYSLVLLDESKVIPIKQYEATMNVTLITLPLGPTGASVRYVMGSDSIATGIMTIPGFTFPFGKKRANGKLQLEGVGYSADIGLHFALDPFQTVVGEAPYPSNLQTTTGVGVNFAGGVEFEDMPTLRVSFSGVTTVSFTGEVTVPNYVPVVNGFLTL